MSYAFVWRQEGRPVLALRDDLNLEPELRDLVQAMDKLVSEPETATRYAIDSTKSFIDVQTGSGGLLASLGHDHKIMVRRLSGTVLADPGDLESASVVLEIDAGSLAVVDDDSAKDRAEIEREMNEHVLEVSKHPTIRFDGRKVRSTPTVDGAFDVVVSGELLLHGKLRRIAVPGRLQVREDSLRFTGRIALLQTDYGIEPTSAVGGTVKVADKVRIGFDVTAVR
jgi:polyisoprenoid-binding protein YceI